MNRLLTVPGAVATLGLLAQAPVQVERSEGGIVRGPIDRRQMALVFTGHEFAEGADTILDVLARRRLHASFFLTGVFLRNPAHERLVRRMVADGHYVGPHSDAHLLYSPWTGPKVSLVTQAEFTDDLLRNHAELARFGISRDASSLFLPSYEWYNAETVAWTRALGSTLICHTRGTRSTADYTEESTRQFVSSDTIFESIRVRERTDRHGLNGFMLLLHVGAGPGRRDKFHRRFDDLVGFLLDRGYSLVRVDTLLAGVDTHAR
jgi:peptidoglycan/xylan/chitin deacetylase (PgdA/CDA1 family)